MPTEDHNKLLELTAQIVAAHVARNQVPSNGLSGLIEQVFTALKSAGETQPAPVVEKPAPFVPAKRSIFPDYIICLEDGRKLKTLKRHLRSTFGLSPEQYREKWGLPPDYPMVAPNYAEHRSRLAKQLGLGRKNAAEEIEEAEPVVVPAKPQRAAAPAPAVIPAPEPPPRIRRSEPTAASVFASFPKSSAAEADSTPSLPDSKKRGRKPFSKQLARTMPR